MTDHFMDRFLYPIEQDLLAQALTVQDAHRFKDQPRLQAVFAPGTLIVGNQTPDCQRSFFAFHELNQLTISMCLKRGECCEKINGFQHAGLALRIGTCKQHDPCWNVDIQTGKVTKVGEREMVEVHRVYATPVLAPGASVVSLRESISDL